ncbi:MAG: hypothetical protein KJN82_04540 [Bacteroidia bacterium]|nr:hypothetical protein [Bacteroidia bacterium]
MKNLLKAFAFAFALFLYYNCSVEPAEIIQEETFVNQQQADPSIEIPDVIDQETSTCTNQDPQAKLINSSLLNADIEVFDSFGMLLTHAYAVSPGDESPILSFPVGITTFVISTSESVKNIEINMATCMIFEVEIDEDNQLDTDTPTPL